MRIMLAGALNRCDTPTQHSIISQKPQDSSSELGRSAISQGNAHVRKHCDGKATTSDRNWERTEARQSAFDQLCVLVVDLQGLWKRAVQLRERMDSAHEQAVRRRCAQQHHMLCEVRGAERGRNAVLAHAGGVQDAADDGVQQVLRGNAHLHTSGNPK